MGQSFIFYDINFETTTKSSDTKTNSNLTFMRVLSSN
jgi:hypothetical protein